MKALSIRQPWAWAIIYGGKDIESRSRRTTFRGTFAVHASGQAAVDWEFPRRSVRPPDEEEWVLGAIIGFVDLVDVVDDHPSKWYASGHWGYVLANPRPLRKPVPCKGKLGFWDVPPAILRRCRS